MPVFAVHGACDTLASACFTAADGTPESLQADPFGSYDRDRLQMFLRRSRLAVWSMSVFSVHVACDTLASACFTAVYGTRERIQADPCGRYDRDRARVYICRSRSAAWSMG